MFWYNKAINKLHRKLFFSIESTLLIVHQRPICEMIKLFGGKWLLQLHENIKYWKKKQMKY